MSYYSDEEIDRALTAWEADPWHKPFPITDEQRSRLTLHQAVRYSEALTRVTFRFAVDAAAAWWDGPPGTPIPPGGVWTYEPADLDEELRRLTEDGDSRPQDGR